MPVKAHSGTRKKNYRLSRTQPRRVAGAEPLVLTPLLSSRFSKRTLPVRYYSRAYYADGVGGRRISAIPSLNVVMVTTGGGFEIDHVTPYITAAFVDKNNPLPANTAAVDALKQSIETIAQSPDKPGPVPVLPATAKVISGKTFIFEQGQNSVVKAMRLDFDRSNGGAQAQFHLTAADYQPDRGGPIGLDGVYRISSLPGPTYLPEAWRGRWVGEQTFMMDYDRISGRERFTVTLCFESSAEGNVSDRVIFQAQGRSGEGTIRAEGKVQVQNP